METRAGYIAVGIAVLAILSFGIGFVVWMGGQASTQGYRAFWVDFNGSVAGLRKGSTVAYRGISVGEVTGMRIHPDNVEKVRVTIEIDAETPIKTDTVASLELQGLAGGSLIQLTGGTQNAPVMPDPENGYPIIPTKASSLQKLFEGAPALVDRVNQLVSRATLLLDDENLSAVSSILANGDQLSQKLDRASGPLGDLVKEAQETIVTVKATALRIDRLTEVAEKELVTSISGAAETLSSTNDALVRAAQALVQVEEAARKIGNASAQVDALLAENRGPIRDFTNVTLYDANAFIAEVRELVISLRQITNDLNRDPSGFIFGNQQRGYEAR